MNRMAAVAAVLFIGMLALAPRALATQYIFETIYYPGADSMSVHGISDNGQVVGSYEDSKAATHGFVYSAGTFTEIDYPQPSGSSSLPPYTKPQALVCASPNGSN